jgi:hypothetical protein
MSDGFRREKISDLFPVFLRVLFSHQNSMNVITNSGDVLMKKKGSFKMQKFLQLLAVTVISVSAVTFQVGPQKTYTRLQDVTPKLKAGDTVLVDGNAQYTGDVKFTVAGTNVKPIIVKGIRIEGKKPVISGGTNTVHFNGCDHMVFEGFEVTGGKSRGIFFQADSVVIRDVAVHDCPQQGILGADIGSGTLTLEYSEVYRCGSGGSMHQIYMTTDEVNFPGSVFRMQYCYIHDANGGNNVKSRSERNEIYYNWIEGAYYHELELIGSDPGGVDDGWTIGLKREDSDVVGNVLFKRKTAANNDSNFSVTRCGGDATGWTHGKYRFVNNTIIAGSGAVFRLFDTLQSIEMHNNIFYRSAGGVNMIRAAEGEMAWSTGKAVYAGSNNWVVTGTTNIPKEWIGTITGANPGFVNFKEKNLKLEGTSLCVNAGNEDCVSPSGFPFTNPLKKPSGIPPLGVPPSPEGNYVRPVNGVNDIGAYEYSSGSVISRRNTIHNREPVSFRYLGDGVLQIRFSQTISGNTEMKLYRLSGQLAACKTIDLSGTSEKSLTWNLNEKQKRFCGTYLLEIRVSGETVKSGKIRL